jgi:leucine dehydrogenase
MSGLLAAMERDDFEQVMALQNRASGLRGFLAIHDTTLGPALGGIRIWRYASEDAALQDALRLARGMTYKAALAGLRCGGGKATLIEHPGLQREAAFEALGAVVESLRGRFFTGRDVGIRDADLEAVARATSYVSREPSPELGDISEHTATGVWHGMRACLESRGIRKPRVAIQGAGSVGMLLARRLRQEGAEVIVADIDAKRAKLAAEELGARVAEPGEILFTECDVLAPCALGGVLNPEIVPRLRCQIVCGSANNVLRSTEDGDALEFERGILYAPDYLVNAGGLIRGAEFHLLGVRDSGPSLERIHERMQSVIAYAKEHRVSTARAADAMAEARFRPQGREKRFGELTWESPAPAARRAGG